MAANFAIVTQTPTHDIGATGAVVPAIQVTFVTKPNNIQGVVTIPTAGYTPDEVARVVGASARVLEEVQEL